MSLGAHSAGTLFSSRMMVYFPRSAGVAEGVPKVCRWPAKWHKHTLGCVQRNSRTTDRDAGGSRAAQEDRTATQDSGEEEL